MTTLLGHDPAEELLVEVHRPPECVEDFRGDGVEPIHVGRLMVVMVMEMAVRRVHGTSLPFEQGWAA